MTSASWSWRSTCSLGLADLADDRVAGHPDVVEADDREPAGQVDACCIGVDRHARRVGGDEHLGEPVAGAAGDEQVLGLVGRLDRSLHAVEHDVVAVDADARGRRRRGGRAGGGSPKHHEAIEVPASRSASTSAWRAVDRALSAAATTLVGDERAGRGVRPNSWATA